MTQIHETAIVSDKATLGSNVQVGPYSIIEDNVVIGNDSVIKNNVTIANGARIGERVQVFSGAVISTAPQDLKFKGENTEVFIGNDTVIREFATINKGTVATGKTVVGENCLLMAYTHVAHDCIVGNNVIMSNVTQLAGHVVIEDYVTLGGVVKVHQFCSVGKHAMIGADTKLVKDVPPFTLVGREPAKIQGINKIGLKRRGFTDQEVKEIDDFYNELLFSGLNNSDAIRKLEEKNTSDHITYCIEFIRASKRGTYR